MHRLKFIGLALSALVFAVTAFAGGHMSSPDGGSMGIPPKMMEKLGLSDTQKQDLGSLMGIYQPRFKQLIERGEQNRKRLLELAPDDPDYSALTTSVSDDAGRTATEMVVLLAEMQTNAYALLTTEQQAEYMQMRVEMRERMEAKRAEMEACRESGAEDCGRHGKGHHGMHGKGHHGNHGEGHVCEHGEDGVCPHHSGDEAAAAE